MCVHVWISPNVMHQDCIHVTLLPQAGCNTKSIFKLSTIDLIQEFSFSKTGFHTKFKEQSLLYYLSMAMGRIVWSILFPMLSYNNRLFRIFFFFNLKQFAQNGKIKEAKHWGEGRKWNFIQRRLLSKTIYQQVDHF